MVKHYWERHADFKAALEAAREALIVAEQSESTYNDLLARPHQPRAYIMDARYASAGDARKRYWAACQQAIEHVNDAMAAWSSDD